MAHKILDVLLRLWGSVEYCNGRALIKEDLALAREQRDELDALMTTLSVIIPNANKQHDG